MGLPAHQTFTLTVLPKPPTITNVSPNTGPNSGGTSVTITGTGFTGATNVYFGGVPATSFIVNSATSITAVSPANVAGTVDIQVGTIGGFNDIVPADHFTYLGGPTVTGVSPTSGPSGGGTTVTISGTNLLGATGVSFGGVAATTVFNNTSTSLLVVSPPHVNGTVDIVVTTQGGSSATSAADHFTYITAPLVSGVSPNSGPVTGATSVTITGTDLNGATAVAFGGTAAASFTVNSATSITAVTPADAAGTVDVVVTTPAGTSIITGADQFTFTKVNQTITFGAITDKTISQSPLSVSATALVRTRSELHHDDPPGVHRGRHQRRDDHLRRGRHLHGRSRPGRQRHIQRGAVGAAVVQHRQGRPDHHVPVAPEPHARAVAGHGLGDRDLRARGDVHVATPSVCTTGGTNGSTVTLVAAGTCTVKADQAGNATFNAAPSVQQSFTVSKVSQTISFGSIVDKTLASRRSRFRRRRRRA